MRRDTVGGTILVAAVLCVVCSIIVSSAAVLLRPLQEENALLDKQRNVLAAAGLLEVGDTPAQVSEKFKKVELQIVNLETGQIASEEEIDRATFDQADSRGDSSLNRAIPSGALPGYSYVEKYSEVYLVKSDDGTLQQVVLPVYGKGLWSTMEGFVALESDLQTAKGMTFYSHGETPGLGGEVDNPNWKAQWPGTKLLDEEGNVLVQVRKAGTVNDEETQVDGLSGATITTVGVNGFVRFWLGEYGFGPFIENLKNQENSRG